MNTAVRAAKSSDGAPAAAQVGKASAPSQGLPDLEFRLTPVCAWAFMFLARMAFGIGFLFLLPMLPGHNMVAGIVICLLAGGGMVGANHLRKHPPVRVRMTSRHLFLPGLFRPACVSVAWNDIAALDIVCSRGTFVCIKLKSRPPNAKPKSWWGYDLTFCPQKAVACSARAFADECRKRMAAIEKR